MQTFSLDHRYPTRYKIESVDKEMWIDVFNRLGHLPPDMDMDSRLQYLQWRLRRMATIDVIRREFDSNLKFSGPWNVKQEIEKHSLVAWRLLLLTSRVFLANSHGYKHPSYWWGRVMAEMESWMAVSNKPGKPYVTSESEYFQHVTQSLRDRTKTEDGGFIIPFDRPHTRKLFEAAMRLATNSDDFRKTTYADYIDARVTLWKWLDRNGAVVAWDDKAQKLIFSKSRRKKSTKKSKNLDFYPL